jgi:NDP-sugar pyrophosphorylase family protein
MQDCNIGSYSSFKGTVIGNGTSVGSHSIAIPITRDILYFDQTFSVSDRGAMIGDNCTIGNRAILQGGSILMSDATIGEGEFYNADFQGENI